MLIPARARGQFAIAMPAGYGYAGVLCNARAVYSHERMLLHRFCEIAVHTAPADGTYPIFIRRLRVGHVWELRETDAFAQGFSSWRDMLEGWAERHDGLWWRWLQAQDILHMMPMMIRYRPAEVWRCATVNYERLGNGNGQKRT